MNTRIRVDTTGKLEIPADLVKELGFATGEEFVVIRAKVADRTELMLLPKVTVHPEWKNRVFRARKGNNAPKNLYHLQFWACKRSKTRFLVYPLNAYLPKFQPSDPLTKPLTLGIKHDPDTGQYVAACPELDLAVDGDNQEDAIAELVEAMEEYAEDYLARFDLFASSPNRSGHFPWILSIARCGSKADIRRLLTIPMNVQDGKYSSVGAERLMKFDHQNG
jgi:predicted RNase H-like HicB family nuclease